jgi:hypothetical protein
MLRSGYVLAGFETLTTIIDNYMLGKRGRWNDNFSRDQISAFLSESCSGYLHSYGQNFGRRKKMEKHNINEANLFKKCRETGLFNNCTFIADSGGFQISIGKFDRKTADLLISMYYEFLEEYHEVLEKAFILDVPPGPGCKIFESFDDVYRLNLASYLKAKMLPESVRKKIIYIHHFRTPKLWEIYTKILRENNLFPEFNYHGTGGIVANMSGDVAIPCIIYVLPLIPLLNECKRHNKDYLNFHVLGGANYRDILFYELFRKVVFEEHKIKLHITYDSSGIYKQVMHARFLHVRDTHGNISKLDVKTKNLHRRFKSEDAIVSNVYNKVLNDFAVQFGFKPISFDEGVYDPKTGTFFEDIKTYSILYTLNTYGDVQAIMNDFANRVYPIYKSGDPEDFNRECLHATRIINQGKITKKQKTKSYSISKSLDMLKNLDEGYCQYLVNKFLAKDEFKELENGHSILTM